MTSTALIEPPASNRAAGIDPDDALAALPPLLGIVPVAGPDVFMYTAFGAVLLVLLVPPFALLATLAGVALVAAAALVVLAAVVTAIVAAPLLLVRVLRRHPPRAFSLRVAPVREVKVRRV